MVEARHRAQAEVLRGVVGDLPAAEFDQLLKERRAHERGHFAPQAIPPWSRVLEQTDRVATHLQVNERRQEIVEYIGRHRLVTPKQIAERFFSHSKNPLRLAYRALQEMLAPYHVVVRVRVGDYQRDQFREVYGLGPAGALWLHNRGEEKWEWISGPDDVSFGQLLHDIEVTDLFNAQWHSAGTKDLDGIPVTTSLSIYNCWAAYHVSVAAIGSHNWLNRKTIRPDGFCAVGLKFEREVPGIATTSTLLPKFVENDAGTKDPRLVAKQLLAYFPLGQSRAPLLRFPEMNIEGFDPEDYTSRYLTAEQKRVLANPQYMVPVEMTFSLTPKPGETDEQLRARVRLRMQRVFKIVIELAEEGGFIKRTRDGEGWVGLKPPIWVVDRSEHLQLGDQAPAFGLWDSNSYWDDTGAAPTALKRLVVANMPLIRQGQLSAESVLQIDPTAAVWKGPTGWERNRKRKSARAAGAGPVDRAPVQPEARSSAIAMPAAGGEGR